MSIKCIKCDGEYKLCDGATIDIMPPIEPYKCDKCGHKLSAQMVDGFLTNIQYHKDSFKFEINWGVEIPFYHEGKAISKEDWDKL